MSNSTVRGARTQRPPRPPARSIRLLHHPATGCGLVRITVGDLVTDYFLDELDPKGFGRRSFALRKVTAAEGAPDAIYRVLLGGPYGNSCNCPGHAEHNTCKHADGLAQLDARNVL